MTQRPWFPSCLAYLAAFAPALGAQQQGGPVAGPSFAVSFPRERSARPLDGRLLLLISSDSTKEPRFQIADGPETQLVFGVDVDGLAPGKPAIVGSGAFGYPVTSLRDLPPGRYWVQALLNRYETFRRADGHVVKLPPDMGEGQHWERKPGNLYSTAKWVRIDPRLRIGPVPLLLDQEIPPIPPPEETKYVKHVRIQSRLLSQFWGSPVYLGAHVLLPEGFDEHPNARYPLVISHGHFPESIGGWRETAPDPNLVPDSSARFQLKGYNRIEQQYAYQLYQDWTGPGFPRVLVIEIQHPTPYYDDSYAVNSANNGPYGDALMQELIPYIEQKYRVPRRVQWSLDRLPRSDRFQGVHRGESLPRHQRVPAGQPLEADAAPGAPRLAGSGERDAGGDEPQGAGARDPRPLRRAVGHLAGGVLTGRRRRLPQADLEQAHRRD